jgi:hypothetical protein
MFQSAELRYQATVGVLVEPIFRFWTSSIFTSKFINMDITYYETIWKGW